MIWVRFGLAAVTGGFGQIATFVKFAQGSASVFMRQSSVLVKADIAPAGQRWFDFCRQLFLGHIVNVNGIVLMSLKYVASAIERFLEAQGLETLNVDNHSWAGQEDLDEALQFNMQERYTSFVDERAPLDVLIKIGADDSWTEADVRLLSLLTPSELRQIFPLLEGAQINASIHAILRIAETKSYARSQGLEDKVRSALQCIASMSPITARKLESLTPPIRR